MHPSNSVRQMTCEHLLSSLGVSYLLNDEETCNTLLINGFTTHNSLIGVKKRTLRKLGMKYGHVNELVNAVNNSKASHNARTQRGSKWLLPADREATVIHSRHHAALRCPLSHHHTPEAASSGSLGCSSLIRGTKMSKTETTNVGSYN